MSLVGTVTEHRIIAGIRSLGRGKICSTVAASGILHPSTNLSLRRRRRRRKYQSRFLDEGFGTRHRSGYLGLLF